MMEDVLIHVIQGWLGCKEGSEQHKRIIDAFNNNREQGEYKMTLYDPWCAAGISAAAAIAGLKGVFPISCNCDQMIRWFSERGQIAAGTKIPVKGWIAFYDWDGDKKSDHVGIVTGVSSTTITLLECNIADTVAYRSIQVADRRIFCYGVPDYRSPLLSSVNYTSYFNRLSIDDQKAVASLPILKQGSKGLYVKVLQAFLNYKGKAGLDIDGEFGIKTGVALHTYQVSKHLEADNICGKETYASFFA